MSFTVIVVENKDAVANLTGDQVLAAPQETERFRQTFETVDLSKLVITLNTKPRQRRSANKQKSLPV